LQEDINTLADVVAQSDADLFNQNDRLVWLDEGSLVPVNRDIFSSSSPSTSPSKKLVNRDGRWERELCPFVPDDMTLRALLSGMSPMRSATRILLPGGGLLGRVPKALVACARVGLIDHVPKAWGTGRASSACSRDRRMGGGLIALI
jgi:hypothetical protein